MKADFTLFFFGVFVVAALAGWEWPNIAKIMPVYAAAIPGVILAAVQVYRNASNWEQRRGRVSGAIEMDEVTDVKLDKATELSRTLGFFGWFIGGALGIWLLGMVVSLPLLVFLYALIEGGEKWHAAIIAAVCTHALVWGLFEYMLETRWPAGLLFS